MNDLVTNSNPPDGSVLAAHDYLQLEEAVRASTDVLERTWLGDKSFESKHARAQLKRLIAASRTLLRYLNVSETVWKAEAPTEQGVYWHWNGHLDDAPFPLFVMYSGTEKKCFVAVNSMANTPWCDELGGYWSEIVEPPVPTHLPR